ncbi:MAG: nitrile hydratase subunit beta [Rhodospirillales bacterium]|nr:nitrile hydratase subunit beta [Rhodospirillales bacterium]
MKLQHYLGGLEGLGPVDFEKRVFVEEWEKRIFGIHVAMMGLSTHLSLPATSSMFKSKWTWADLRTGAEGMNPFDYFKFRYYEKWLGGISSHFIASGYITEDELSRETANVLNGEYTQASGGDTAIDERIEKYLVTGDSARQPAAITPRFAAGDRVVVKNPPATEHTRLPGFLRCKTGIVETVYDGAYSYFCSTGDGIGPAMPVYCVKFEPDELWGKIAEPGFAIYADLFDAYLSPRAA